MIVGVIGLPINKSGQMLIALRNDPQHPKFHHKWHLPGGEMEFGELPETTLKREIKEELGVIPKILFPYPIAKTKTWQLNNTHYHLTYICYLISLNPNSIRLNDQEIAAIKWIKPNQITNYPVIPPTAEIIHKAQKIHKKYGL